MTDPDEETENAVRDRMGAVRKPWFLPIALLMVLAVPAISSTLTTSVFHAKADIGPLLAMVAGALGAIGALGHSPAMYSDPETGQYSLYWSPRSRRSRVVLGVVAVALVMLGILVDCLRH